MKVNISMGKKTVKVLSLLQTAAFIKDNSIKMKYQDKEHITGQTKRHIADIGWKIRCMVREFFNGLTANSMKVSFKMIKEREKENSLGKMVVYTMASGKKENKMEKVFSSTKRENQDVEYGKMERI
jgi:hypothetical protein